MSLADLNVHQLMRIVTHARFLKQNTEPWLLPQDRGSEFTKSLRMPSQSLFMKTVALLFSKRSTRTRIAAETAASILGGRALFLGRDDIQLGVNESMRDSARVIGGMCQGIFARVGDHSEIEVGKFAVQWVPMFMVTRCRNWPSTHLCLCSTRSHRCGTRRKSSQTCSHCTSMRISLTLASNHCP